MRRLLSYLRALFGARSRSMSEQERVRQLADMVCSERPQYVLVFREGHDFRPGGGQVVRAGDPVLSPRGAIVLTDQPWDAPLYLGSPGDNWFRWIPLPGEWRDRAGMDLYHFVRGEGLADVVCLIRCVYPEANFEAMSEESLERLLTGRRT